MHLLHGIGNMAFYDDMRNMAIDLLTQFGNPFVLKKKSGEPVYNPKTKKTEQLYKEFPGVCVKKTYSAEAAGMLGNIINAGECTFVCTMNDISVIPEETVDKVVFQNITYNIIDVATSDPSGTSIIVHFLHCKKA